MLQDFAGLRNEIELGLPGADVLLKDLPEVATKLGSRLQAMLDLRADANDEQTNLLRRLVSMVAAASNDASRLISDLVAISEDAERIADETEFAFLWNARRKLLSIGMESEKGEVHAACYDLLASEARTAAFVSVAKDEVPQETWFLLARTHVAPLGRPVLLSWTGTMFEYLMPAIWMRTYTGTLLDRSRHAAVQMQREYTVTRRIPWGISESAYAVRDEAGTYQYHAFGVPQLALHQGDIEALVISPYATALALSTAPKAALDNLRRISHEGWFGAYGFYESADYTASRHRKWRHDFELVRCYMAHHQGMTLLSIANFLADGVVQEWFHAHPRVMATELLLHEKPVNYLPSGHPAA